ncbi:MAG: ribonuclease P protein component [Chitinophagales bacterium]|nr:ribonuclease P protein component [Hyphomicrobiales bacterium]
METLKRRQDFLRLKTGRKWTSPAFVLQTLPQASDPADTLAPPPRFGFTVSDRAIATVETSGQKRGGAVKRNRARRRLKEVTRILAQHHAKSGFDYVIIGRMAALNRDFADLLADMRLAFHKVHASGAAANASRRNSGIQPPLSPPPGSRSDC